MVSNVDGLLPKAPAELGEICHTDVIQRPKQVLVERCVTLVNTDLDAVRQEVVLPYQIALKNAGIEGTVVLFNHHHERR